MAAEVNNGEQSRIYSFEAEQAVLGSIIFDPKSFSVAAMHIKSEYFYYPQHRKIYEIMEYLDMTTGTVDLLMLLEQLRAKNVFSGDDGGKQYLMQLSDSVPSASNIEAYCKIIKDKFLLRTLVSVANKIIQDAENSEDSADLLLARAEELIYNIRQGKSDDGPESIGVVLRNVNDMLNKLNSDDREKYIGLSTGFPDFDKMCTGLNRSDLVIIGARPAMGKTAFTLNMARNVAVKTGKKVIFFSLEMSKEQLAQRVISSEARIPSQKLRTGLLTPDEWEAFFSANMFLVDLPLYFDDSSSTTVPEMKSKVRRLKADVVFVDYLQLMHSPQKTDSRVQEVSEITRSLKLMAKDLNVPVVVCAQLSRGTESRGNKSHKPQLADLRESGSIEQDADIVAMLYREQYYSNDENNKNSEQNVNGEQDPAVNINVNLALLLVQKNRHGPTGEIQLAWNPEYTMYTCIEHDNNAGYGN